MFLEQWIEQDGPTALPAPFLNLNPLDLHLWGYLKSTVYATIVSYAQDIQQQVQNGSEMIRTTPGIFQKVR